MTRYECRDVTAAAARMIRAVGRRVADGDPEDLAELLALSDVLHESTRVAVDGLRAQGRSWAEIAAPLGTTRQAAFKRWGEG